MSRKRKLFVSMVTSTAAQMIHMIWIKLDLMGLNSLDSEGTFTRGSHACFTQSKPASSKSFCQTESGRMFCMYLKRIQTKWLRLPQPFSKWHVSRQHKICWRRTGLLLHLCKQETLEDLAQMGENAGQLPFNVNMERLILTAEDSQKLSILRWYLSHCFTVYRVYHGW